MIRVIDGDTFEVDRNWYWKNQYGSIVRPIGYNAPEMSEVLGREAKVWLIRLILNKFVYLKSPVKIHGERLVCRVSFERKDLKDHYRVWDNSMIPTAIRSRRD